MDDAKCLADIAKLVGDEVNDVDHKHIYPVVKILVEEIIHHLIKYGTVGIAKFGVFSLDKLRDFEHHVFREGVKGKGGGRREVATNRKLLRFRLEWKLRQKLIEHLARDKTFDKGIDDAQHDGYNEGSPETAR